MTSANSSVLTDLLSYELFQSYHRILEAKSNDWKTVLDEGNRHVVEALLYQGLKLMKDCPEKVLAQARRAALFSARASDEVLRNQAEILQLLEAYHIPCAVLKGTSVACCYPHPELRLPGDIDILVGEENLQTAYKALAEAGFTYSHTTKLHVCLHKHDIDVELHSAVSYFPEEKKGILTEQFMEDALQHTEIAQLQETFFPVLSGVYQLIALLSHMERHLVSMGIGLRQLCDWAVTVHAKRQSIGDNELKILEQCGLLQFAKVATKTSEKYLGLPPFSWCADITDELCDALMSDIMESGNFHAQHDVRPLVFAMTDAYNTDGSKHQSILRSYLKYVRKRIHEEHPQKKSPLWIPAFSIFYPARWMVRMVQGKRKKVNLKQSIHSAKEREKMLQGLKLYK